MNGRLASVPVWGFWIVMIAAVIAAGTLSLTEQSEHLRQLVDNALLVLISFVYATVGLVVTPRVPGDQIGWILLGGLLFGVTSSGETTLRNLAAHFGVDRDPETRGILVDRKPPLRNPRTIRVQPPFGPP